MRNFVNSGKVIETSSVLKNFLEFEETGFELNIPMEFMSDIWSMIN